MVSDGWIMKVLSPELIEKAYIVIGGRPSDMEWIDLESKRCSPILALALAAKQYQPEDIPRLFDNLKLDEAAKYLASALNLHIAYVCGFEVGFALLNPHEVSLPGYIAETEFFSDGLKDGQNAFKSITIKV